MGRLEERWRRRTSGLSAGSRTVRFQEAARLRHPPGAVWALIQPAECAPLLSSTTARGFKVPGTPDGVGEQQCFIDLEGNATIIEVTHIEVERCATTRVVSPSPPVPTRMRFEIQPIGVGCIVIVTSEVDLPAGRIVRPDGETEWRHWAAEYLERIRRVLDDEVRSPSFRA
jgi:hypothetical protein